MKEQMHDDLESAKSGTRTDAALRGTHAKTPHTDALRHRQAHRDWDLGIHKAVDYPALLGEWKGLCLRLESALSAILADPYGCRFCDSGKLRHPHGCHDPECGYGRAAKIGLEET